MYAIIRTGGKQSKVSEGDVIDVERLKTAGDEVTFTPLLVVDDKGKTVTDRDKLAKMTVKAKVLGEVKGDKIDIFKYKNKSGYRRRAGPSSAVHATRDHWHYQATSTRQEEGGRRCFRRRDEACSKEACGEEARGQEARSQEEHRGGVNV